MRESRSYGVVRGALSNGRPYRDPYPTASSTMDFGTPTAAADGFFTPRDGSKKRDGSPLENARRIDFYSRRAWSPADFRCADGTGSFFRPEIGRADG